MAIRWLTRFRPPAFLPFGFWFGASGAGGIGTGLK
jgi:hypothetical protein